MSEILISLLPPLQTDTHRDAFDALMRSVFNAGYDVGAAKVAGAFLDAMIRNKTER